MTNNWPDIWTKFSSRLNSILIIQDKPCKDILQPVFNVCSPLIIRTYKTECHSLSTSDTIAENNDSQYVKWLQANGYQFPNVN